MSGPELVEELRSRGCEAPTIFVSGSGADAFSNPGVRVDRAVVREPFQTDTLLGAVREVLDAAVLASLARPAAGVVNDGGSARLDAWRRDEQICTHKPGAAATPEREPLSSECSASSLTAHCLSCGTLYQRHAGRDVTTGSRCPRCEHVGWVAAE
jgi:hypothetical protein